MPGDASVAAVLELIQFLNARTRPEVRHPAIAYIVGVSATPEGPELFQSHNFALGKALCTLFESVPGDRPAIYSAFINITSDDAASSNFILETSSVVPLSAAHCRDGDSVAAGAAKLLSNLSLHFSAKVHDRVTKEWATFLGDAVDLLNSNSSEDYVDYLGYTIVNCTEIPNIRRAICEKHLKKILPLIAQNERPKRRLIAVDIVRNLCFDDGSHDKLLDSNDEFLAALLAPLADADDMLDDEEIQKLPLQIQYYDGKRCSDPLIVKKLIEALYQLCATKHGRSVLRNKGAYAVLREFDKATSSGAGVDSEGNIGKHQFLVDAAESSALHSLIGILIRYESEMNIDPQLTSIRDLQ